MKIQIIKRNYIDNDLIISLQKNNNYKSDGYLLFITFDGKLRDIGYKNINSKTASERGCVQDIAVPFSLTTTESIYPKKCLVTDGYGLSVPSLLLCLEKLKERGFDMRQLNLIIDMYQIAEWYDENTEYFHTILKKYFNQVQNTYLLI